MLEYLLCVVYNVIFLVLKNRSDYLCMGCFVGVYWLGTMLAPAVRVVSSNFANFTDWTFSSLLFFTFWVLVVLARKCFPELGRLGLCVRVVVRCYS